MIKNLKILANVFIWLVVVVALYHTGKLCFFLMSQKSTFENTIGFIFTVFLITIIILFTINKLKRNK